jgi:hypothetical protein
MSFIWKNEYKVMYAHGLPCFALIYQHILIKLLSWWKSLDFVPALKRDGIETQNIRSPAASTERLEQEIWRKINWALVDLWSLCGWSWHKWLSGIFWKYIILKFGKEAVCRMFVCEREKSWFLLWCYFWVGKQSIREIPITRTVRPSGHPSNNLSKS